MRDYEVTINFGGFIGCETTYTVFAENEDEAIKEAMELAMDDCSVESVKEIIMDRQEIKERIAEW